MAQLYMLEILIENIYFYDVESVHPRKDISFAVTFGNLFDLRIVSNEVLTGKKIAETKNYHVSADVPFNYGKSHLFSSSPNDLLAAMKFNDLKFEIFLKNSAEPYGQYVMRWKPAFFEIVDVKDSSSSAPKTMHCNESVQFHDLKSSKNVVLVDFYLRFSNFGTQIETQFEISPTEEECVNRRKHAFKNVDVESLFKLSKIEKADAMRGSPSAHTWKPLFVTPFESCRSFMPSELKVLLGLDKEEPPQTTDAASSIRPEVELTASTINGLLCTNRHCPGTVKFRDLGLGPLAAKGAGLGSPSTQGKPVKTYGMSNTYGTLDNYGPYGLLDKKKDKKNKFRMSAGKSSDPDIPGADPGYCRQHRTYGDCFAGNCCGAGRRPSPKGCGDERCESADAGKPDAKVPADAQKNDADQSSQKRKSADGGKADVCPCSAKVPADGEKNDADKSSQKRKSTDSGKSDACPCSRKAQPGRQRNESAPRETGKSSKKRKSTDSGNSGTCPCSGRPKAEEAGGDEDGEKCADSDGGGGGGGGPRPETACRASGNGAAIPKITVDAVRKFNEELQAMLEAGPANPCTRQTCQILKFPTCDDCGGFTFSGATCAHKDVPFVDTGVDYSKLFKAPPPAAAAEDQVSEATSKTDSKLKKDKHKKRRNTEYTEKQAQQLDKKVTLKTAKKTRFVYEVGEYYPGIRVGHRNCVTCAKNVPAAMGWLWNIETDGLKKRRGWRPGVLGKKVNELIENHRKSLGLPDMPELKMLVNTHKKQRPPRPVPDEEPDDPIEPKPTLVIKKRNGTYWITMHPLKEDQKKLAENENPYLNCTPMQFVIEKKKKVEENSSNSSDLENEYRDCLCDEDLMAASEESASSSSDSELDIELTTPAGLIVPELMRRKPNVIHTDTQYKEADLTSPDCYVLYPKNVRSKKKVKLRK